MRFLYFFAIIFAISILLVEGKLSGKTNRKKKANTKSKTKSKTQTKKTTKGCPLLTPTKTSPPPDIGNKADQSCPLTPQPSKQVDSSPADEACEKCQKEGGCSNIVNIPPPYDIEAEQKKLNDLINLAQKNSDESKTYKTIVDNNNDKKEQLECTARRTKQESSELIEEAMQQMAQAEKLKVEAKKVDLESQGKKTMALIRGEQSASFYQAGKEHAKKACGSKQRGNSFHQKSKDNYIAAQNAQQSNDENKKDNSDMQGNMHQKRQADSDAKDIEAKVNEINKKMEDISNTPNQTQSIDNALVTDNTYEQCILPRKKQNPSSASTNNFSTGSGANPSGNSSGSTSSFSGGAGTTGFLTAIK